MLDITRRAAATARIDAHANIAIRDPFLRVADFPALILVGGPGYHIRMLERHAIPGGLVAVLEMQPLAIRAIAENDRIAAVLDGPENVAAQHNAVVHRDR